MDRRGEGSGLGWFLFEGACCLVCCVLLCQWVLLCV